MQPKNISFIIQGPILINRSGLSYSTKKCIESIRSLFPESEVIVSTWEGSDVSGLDADFILTSQDPGATPFTNPIKPNKINNVNRQIISTLAGLKVAKHPYAVKMRGDTLITGNNFISIFEKKFSRYRDIIIFNQRILTVCYYCRDPNIYPLLHHPGDIFQFGTREDLLKLWDIPLAPEPETSRWLENKERPHPDLRAQELLRYTPEQYIWIACLRKHGFNIQLDHPCQIKSGQIVFSELAIVNNFIIGQPKQMGIKLPNRIRSGDPFSIYLYKDWLLSQKKYCNGALSQTEYILKFTRKIVRRILCFFYLSTKNFIVFLRNNFGEKVIPVITFKN